MDYQSSFDFLREFDNNFQRATVSNRRSQVFLSKSWSKMSLSVRASQFETYFPEYGGPAGNSILTRYLPQISLNSYKLKLAGPLYLSFGGGFSRWQYGWKTDYDAGTELRTQTASFAPVLSLPWSALPWLSASFAVSGAFNYYWQTYAKDAVTGVRSIVDDPLLAMSYGLAAEVIGPVFYRIYDLKSGARIKHLIEPTVSYRYDSPLADRDRIITSSGYFLYHQLAYGFTNHVYVKDPAPAAGAEGGTGEGDGGRGAGGRAAAARGADVGRAADVLCGAGDGAAQLLPGRRQGAGLQRDLELPALFPRGKLQPGRQRLVQPLL